MLAKNKDEYDQLMSSMLEGDKEPIEDGGFIRDMVNQNIKSFSPNLLFEQMVKNFKNTRSIYGDSLLQYVSEESADSIEKNIRFPEYQRQLQIKIKKKARELRHKGLLDAQMQMTDKGLDYASLSLYIEELQELRVQGNLGDHLHKKKSHYGTEEEARAYRKGDRYRDVAVRRSIKTAVRRGHHTIHSEDLRVSERQSRGQQYIVYALDASGSMKGAKVDVCKKAGVALSYHALQNLDLVGLVVFGEDVKCAIPPTDDFIALLRTITRISAAKDTNIKEAIRQATLLFPSTDDVTKHVLVLTDALPTTGENPYEETLHEVSFARAAGITISIIGINLDKDGEEFARRIIEISEGKLYMATSMDEVGSIVLSDYYAL